MQQMVVGDNSINMSHSPFSPVDREFTDNKKMQKNQEKRNFATSSNTTSDVTTERSTEHITNTPFPGVTFHVSDSELNLFPEPAPVNDKKEDCNEAGSRKVYLNKSWQVTDTIGNPDFDGIIESDPNVDWLTFISNNINY